MVFILLQFICWFSCKNKQVEQQYALFTFELIFFVAIYNWKGESRFALPLEIGDTLQILEECDGWYRGFATKNRAHKGIFPQNYICTKVNLKKLQLWLIKIYYH